MELFEACEIAFDHLSVGIEYKLKADTVRRERGLPSRVVFVNSEAAQGDRELPGQGKRECVQTKLRLLVLSTHTLDLLISRTESENL